MEGKDLVEVYEDAPIKNWKWDDCSVGFLCPNCQEEVYLMDEPHACSKCGKVYKLVWFVIQKIGT